MNQTHLHRLLRFTLLVGVAFAPTAVAMGLDCHCVEAMCCHAASCCDGDPHAPGEQNDSLSRDRACQCPPLASPTYLVESRDVKPSAPRHWAVASMTLDTALLADVGPADRTIDDSPGASSHRAQTAYCVWRL